VEPTLTIRSCIAPEASIRGPLASKMLGPGPIGDVELFTCQVYPAKGREPGATLADALKLMERHRISGVPVVESPNGMGADSKMIGKLVGILTNRDVRFAADPRQKVAELMTTQLVTVREGVQPDEAKRLLHQHRIEKILVVDSAYRCVGLITVKDIEKAQKYPHACKDERGRLRVAAATGVGDDGLSGSDVEGTIFVFDAKRAFEDDGEFVEGGSLAGFEPSGGAAHVGDAGG